MCALPEMVPTDSVLLVSSRPTFSDRTMFYAVSPDEVVTSTAESFSWDRLRALSRSRFVVGYLSYDLGAALCGLSPRQGPMPTFWLGCYDRVRVGDAISGRWHTWHANGKKYPCDPPSLPKAQPAGLKFQGLDQTQAEYQATVERIRREIEHGHYYQVNYTMRARFHAFGTPYDTFCRLMADQAVPYGALLHTQQGSVISGSPELFLKLRDGRLLTKPMKGTAACRPGARRKLKASVKDRAENLMIVDLMRHDLGKVCRRVWVDDLFRVERFATLFQMVSCVHGELAPQSDGVDLLAACFPPGSVTGAPKSSVVEAIHRLERSPRGVYTGIIGVMFPWDELRFSVAIRTCEQVGDTLWYGLGSGITYASRAADEWRECLAKMVPLRRMDEDRR